MTKFPRVRKLAEEIGWLDYDDKFFEDAYRLQVMMAFLDEFSDSDDHSELALAYENDFNDEYQKNKAKLN